MKIYNSFTNKKETFKPFSKGQVSFYLCGPTVYDKGHVGHARSAISFDVIRKYLQYRGYKVIFVSNYTDIDDKMIKRAAELKISVAQLAERIIPEYQKDYAALRIQPPDIAPRATEFILTIIQMVQDLERKGYAYQAPDGIYYDISKFKRYGKLSKQNLDELEAGARVELNENKRSYHDFALWKFEKRGEPAWESPFGKGRPGWHIECSAMNFELLGETIDIHAGGADLKFPHHEDEIAQSEAFSGKKFVKYWMHNGFIQINQEKMSKSLGNFFTIAEVLNKYDALSLRYFLLATQYRAPIDFSEKLIVQARNSLNRINDFIRALKRVSNTKAKNPSNQIKLLCKKTKKKFILAMDDDFDIAEALAAIFDLIKEVNTMLAGNKIDSNDSRLILSLLREFDQVISIMTFEESEVPAEIQTLIEERELARKEKNWSKADRIRTVIHEKGYELEDTKQGAVCKLSKK